jgi:hypothetical protein
MEYRTFNLGAFGNAKRIVVIFGTFLGDIILSFDFVMYKCIFIFWQPEELFPQ